MSMWATTHQREECRHGTLVRQCRCPCKDKALIIVDCPPNCPSKDES